tara:strand:+ start:403 stop:1227 length:825 start_codon:yes stop_codon:yes gene_type:complete
MAETLTVDTTPQTETVVSDDGSTENLTPEEQESLAVGEQLQEQQEQLLAGKYKNAEELENAYIELQKKFGENSETNSEETKAETETEEEKSTEVSLAAQLVAEASDELYNNDGTLSSETIEKFSSLSSKELVQAYIEMQADLPQYAAENTAEINQQAVNEVQNIVGGEQAYNNMVQWAASNLDQKSIQAFDEICNTGSVEAVKIAVSGLKAQYENATGYEGQMYTGKAPKNEAANVFRSQAELVQAMSDKRYDNDPAYRQDVIAKLDRSNELEF